MLLMLIASAWLEPAPRPVARGLCVWFDGAMVNCLQRQRLGERLPTHSLAAVNGHSSGGIEQIVADLHLRRDNRHTGPAQLRDVRRHSLTAEPEQGVESGDRQAGVQRTGGAAPGRLYLPGNLLVRGRRQPRCIDATNAVCRR